MKKKSFILAGAVVFGLTLGGFNVQASENTKDFNYYQEKGENLTPQDFPEDFQKEILEGKKDLEIQKQKDAASKDYSANNNTMSSSAVTTAASVPSGSMGGKGAILYTASGSSSSAIAWVGGHAALVVDSYNTIEAFGNAGNKNGVRYWTNNFKKRYSDAKAYKVKDASAAKKSAAVAYAKKQLYKPYNSSFFDKTRTDAFYCSQIVWRAYKSQGIDLDKNGGKAVWPTDLVSSKVTKY